MNLPDWQWLNTTIDVVKWIVDFFVLMWNDEEWYLCFIGLFIFIIPVFIIIHKIIGAFSSSSSCSCSSKSNSFQISSAFAQSASHQTKVTIKGVYQMNGPKPFECEVNCSSPSEVGYYSQLMGDKSKQARWIASNFPGADTDKGFSMSINIK